MKRENTLIITPTYNERENIHPLVNAIFEAQPDIHILVVDDNSPDGTAEEVKNHPLFNSQLFLLNRPQKEGLKKAYQAGFQFGIDNNYDYLIQMDADLSHHPKHLKEMFELIETHDLVIGSRYVLQGKTKNWNLKRRFISRGGNLYAKFILNLPFHDLTAGFKCYRQKTLIDINYKSLKCNGYAYQIETVWRTFRKNLRIKEIPIIFEDRQRGETKMSMKIFFEAFFRVLQLRLTFF